LTLNKRHADKTPLVKAFFTV